MKYYVVENGNPVGPFEVAELMERGIKGTDLVWTEGLTDWVAAGSIDEIAYALNNASEPRMPEMPRPFPPVNAAGGEYRQPGGVPPYQQSGGYYQQGGGYNNQPPYQQPAPYEIPPKSWLAESIIMTLCCCFPIGIYCIVKASSVNSLWNCGRYDEAREASDKAKKWLIIGVISGIVLNVICVILNLVFSSAMANLYDI